MAGLAADLVSYDDLYARWERGNWSATELDFSEDARQWQELSPFTRQVIVWNCALFFWGEDAVADNLSPYIDAAPREEQKYFLCTQQVDEARHAVFFTRFMHEVAGFGRGDTASGLEAIRPQLSWGFRRVFRRLDTMADELRANRSKPKLAAAIALYHFIIEASLAQPGQHLLETFFSERKIMPAFLEGIHNVAQDEQRHIGFGVKLLADLVREDPRCRDSVAELLREVVPWTAGVLTPPGGDERYPEALGIRLVDVATEGGTSLESKLRAAGLPIEDLPGPPIFPVGSTPRQWAENGLALVAAGVLGDGEIPPRSDPETQKLVFDTIAGVAQGDGTPSTLQWVFPDAEPWHVRIDNGRTAAVPGLHPSPDLTLRIAWKDWVDVVGRRQDPRKLLVTGRLRPRGSLRTLARMPKMLPG